jgi:hypothetical protein
MHTDYDDDKVPFDALSDTEMKELGEVLAEVAYPGGIGAFAKAAREEIASCVGGAVWKDLELAEAEALTDAEALSGIDRAFPGGLDEFLDLIWAKPAHRFRP